jgi:hypothetical protein
MRTEAVNENTEAEKYKKAYQGLRAWLMQPSPRFAQISCDVIRQFVVDLEKEVFGHSK